MVKQYEKIKYLGCILDQNLSGESMALNVIDKVNLCLKFLHRQNHFLTPPLRKLLRNPLIQPLFDYACTDFKNIKITSSSVTKQVHQVLLTVR